MQRNIPLLVILAGCYNDIVIEKLQRPENRESQSVVPNTVTSAGVALQELLTYYSQLPSEKVDLTAYYFFVSEEMPCMSAVEKTLSSLFLENKIAAVYIPHFHRGHNPDTQALPPPYNTLATANQGLQFSGWQDDQTPGLNGVIYNINTTQTEAIFFNPLGNSTEKRDGWTNKGYAVVAPHALLEDFTSFVNEREARPAVEIYVCTEETKTTTSSPSPN